MTCRARDYKYPNQKLLDWVRPRSRQAYRRCVPILSRPWYRGSDRSRGAFFSSRAALCVRCSILSSILSSKSPWGHLEIAFKSPAEGGFCVIADLVGDLGEAHTFVAFEGVCSEMHAYLGEVLERRSADEGLKTRREVGTGHPDGSA